MRQEDVPYNMLTHTAIVDSMVVRRDVKGGIAYTLKLKADGLKCAPCQHSRGLVGLGLRALLILQLAWVLPAECPDTRWQAGKQAWSCLRAPCTGLTR